MATVIFDLGQVVLRWDARLAFREVLAEAEIDEFLTEISFPEWNARLDVGTDGRLAEGELISRFPNRQSVIEGYRHHFDAAVPGMVAGTAAIIAELEAAGVRLLALTNWAGDLFAKTRPRFDVLQRFEGIVVSGEEGMIKPDPGLFAILLERYQVDAASTVFVDDSPRNCEAAGRLGLDAIQFTDAVQFRAALVERGLLGPESPMVDQPIFHLTERSVWQQSLLAGRHPWSSRELTYEQAGFTHCSLADQIASTRARVYGDRPDADLVVLRLEPDQLSAPVLLEARGGAEAFPHLFGEIVPRQVSAALDLADLLGGDLRDDLRDDTGVAGPETLSGGRY